MCGWTFIGCKFRYSYVLRRCSNHDHLNFRRRFICTQFAFNGALSLAAQPRFNQHSFNQINTTTRSNQLLTTLSQLTQPSNPSHQHTHTHRARAQIKYYDFLWPLLCNALQLLVLQHFTWKSKQSSPFYRIYIVCTRSRKINPNHCWFQLDKARKKLYAHQFQHICAHTNYDDGSFWAL